MMASQGQTLEQAKTMLAALLVAPNPSKES